MKKFSPNSLDKVYKCEKCKDSTFVFKNEEVNGAMYETVVPCECRERIIKEQKLKNATIPKNMDGVNMQNFLMKVYKKDESKQAIIEIAPMVKKYIDEFKDFYKNGTGLFIYSATKGSGKTRLATSVARELIERGYSAKFTTANNAFEQIKASWDKENSELTEHKIMEELLSVDVLILDDLGVEKQSDWANAKLFQIINTRYQNKKPILYTSNFAVNKLFCDSRIKSRIEEVSYILHMAEESIRDGIARERQRNEKKTNK